MVVARRSRSAVVGLVVGVLVTLTACGEQVPDDPDAQAGPTPTPTAQSEESSQPSPSATSTSSPAPTSTPTPSPQSPSPSPDPSGPSPEPSPRPSPSPEPSPQPTPDDSPTPTPAPTTPEPAPDLLQQGNEGAAVTAVQERLVELGYWMPAVDGVFGPQTRHAVVALQKAAGIARDGIVGPVTERALEEGPRPQPRSTTGTVIEIDRTAQLLLLVTDGELRWVFDTATGRSGWTTPAGQFQVQREIDGYRHAPLGTLYRPKYFNQGIAIHGYPNVPPYPASHGCVRVTNAAMDWLWANDAVPIGRDVWVY